MIKENYIGLLAMVLVAIVVLFAPADVRATGDCGANPGECWDFSSLKHRIEFDGVVDVNGTREFRYLITKYGNISIQHFNLAIPYCDVNNACLQITATDDTTQFGRCEGEPTANIGIGDCEHCYTRIQRTLHKGVPELFILTVPAGTGISTVGVTVKASSDQEDGYIKGPSCPPPTVAVTGTRISNDGSGSLTCTAQPDGSEGNCVDDDGNDVASFDNEDVTCTAEVTNPDGTTSSQTINWDFSSEECFIHGTGSSCTWLNWGGRWFQTCR